MKASELIALLHTLPPDMEVMTWVPDANLDVVDKAEVMTVRDSGARPHLCGIYEEYDEEYCKYCDIHAKPGAKPPGKPFDAVVIGTGPIVLDNQGKGD